LTQDGIVAGERKKPAGRIETMKKIALAIAFAVASMPLTFAAQTPANPPAANAGQTNSTSTKKPVKKHVKKVKKSEATKSSAVKSSTSSGHCGHPASFAFGECVWSCARAGGQALGKRTAVKKS
jgi:hypothetical protein